MATQHPAELERRLKALEDPAAQGADFDGFSWFWLISLGLVGPAIILVFGWGL